MNTLAKLYGEFSFEIYETLNGIPLSSDQCKIKITDYPRAVSTKSKGSFSILTE